MCGSTILQCAYCEARIALTPAGFQRVVYGTSSPELMAMGWTEYLVSVRTTWLANAARLQRGFGGGRPVTQVVGPLGNEQTNPRLAWQFNATAACPDGCERKGSVCARV